MRVSILTGSVSRLAGGTFDAIRRPASLFATQQTAFIQVLSTLDAHTESDRSGWLPLSPEAFEVYGPRNYGFTTGMKAALDRFKPDLTHIHGLWMYCSFVNYRFHIRNKTPYLISPHGMLDPWAISNSVWKKRIVGWAYEKNHLARAKCLHALCTSELKSMRDYGLSNPVCVIPNGIDLQINTCKIAAPWAGRLAAGKKVLLYLGRLHPKKGLANLLKAWHQISADSNILNDWVLALAGWDQIGHKASLQKLSTDLDLDKSVLFLGPQFGDAKQACYEHADAFILPSFSEGLPMTVLEAWAYGLPVMMTTQCNLPEGFACNAAIQIEPTPEKIVPGLTELFSLTDKERKEMGARGLSLVKQKFTWEKVAEEMHAVYQWILSGGTPPECVRFA